jgi:hypothetical protein
VARVELGYRQELACVFGVELPVVADDVIEVAKDPWHEQVRVGLEKREGRHRRRVVVEIKGYKSDWE